MEFFFLFFSCVLSYCLAVLLSCLFSHFSGFFIYSLFFGTGLFGIELQKLFSGVLIFTAGLLWAGVDFRSFTVIFGVLFCSGYGEHGYPRLN